MRRRVFLLLSGTGAFLGQMLRPLHARSAQLPAVPQVKALGRGVDVASVAELSKSGQVLVRTSALGPLLVIRDPATQQLKAVNPTCPHRGCLVDWIASSDTFLCPCHKARFNANGRWIGGKAVNRPLTSYKVTVSNGRILVSKG